MTWKHPGTLVAVLVAVAASWAGSAAGQDVIAPRNGLGPAAARLEEMIRREMADKGIPGGSVALVAGNRVVWAKGFGLARPAERIEATASTVYRVGSVSKLFTDLAAMQLVEASRLNLDAPVQDYLPDFAPKNPSSTPITLRRLMAHRSGLSREPPVGHYFDPTSPSLAETVNSLNATALVYPPETLTKYSNAAVSVVGRVVEKVRGEPFAASVKRTVIDPLGLTSATFERTPAVEKSVAHGVMWTYDGRTFDAPRFPLGTSAAGNLYASVIDLGRFLGAVLDGGRGAGGQVVKPETLRAMWEPQPTPEKGPRRFGLGFNLDTLDGRLRVGHGGASTGSPQRSRRCRTTGSAWPWCSRKTSPTRRLPGSPTRPCGSSSP